MLEVGVTGSLEWTVGGTDTARAHGSGELDVLATPALAALMERCCWESVAGELGEGMTTVGTSLELRHSAPTPVGGTVRITSRLVSVDRRALAFEIVASDGAGEVATATHGRFVVDAASFQARADGRRGG